MTSKLLQILIFSLVVLVATTVRADTLKGKEIHICEDAAEWPPYHYLKRENGKKTEEIVGYGIDVLDRIFGKHGISYKIDFLPWKRCLAEVKKGGKYQMALSGSYSRERDDHLANQDLGFAKLSGVDPTWFNMMISKNYVHSPELKKIISEGIAELFWSG